MKEKLLYSFSDGKYWSPYNSCRVWSNNTYSILIKDKYGQISKTEVDILNIMKKDLPLPIINSGNYVEKTVSSEDVILNATSSEPDSDIYYSINNGQNWNLLESSYICSHDTNILFQVRDSYGNMGKIKTFVVYIDKTAPTNINYTPKVTLSKDIETEITVVEDSNFLLQYSISYDDGITWSPYQYGRYFRYFKPLKGIYEIKCRVRNAAGLTVEGQSITITIN